MHPIKEMLKLTSYLQTQSKSDRDLASKDRPQSVNPGFVRERTFKQLGANYQWSEIIFNQRLDTKRKVNVGNKVCTPHGNDEPIQVGDHIPDAPNLALVPVAARANNDNDTLRSPDAFCPYYVGIQAPGKSAPRPTSTQDILNVLGKHNKDGDR